MEQTIVFATLGLALILFAWGKIRHDFVALICLFIVTVTGIISADKAFYGFGHPAVITVASVLIIGRAMELSGVVDLLGQFVSRVGNNLFAQIASLSVITAVASAFMNNVGALAIMMPVAIHLARKGGNSPSYVLMPIAFSSLLGGMMTLIGTPPNIIIAAIRGEMTGEAFGMFDYSPVGLMLTAAGILFITFFGWRLLPKRTSKETDADLFTISDYITEVKLLSSSKIKGAAIAELRSKTETDIIVLALIRDKRKLPTPDPDLILKTGDILIIETNARELRQFIEKSSTKLVGGKKFRSDARGSENVDLAEAVIINDSPLVEETAVSLNMRSRYGINLLAVARKEKKIRRRLDHVIFKPGDVILIQGRSHLLNDTIRAMKCLPLAKRRLNIGYQKKISFSLGIFGFSVFLVVAGFLPVQIAFAMAALAFVLSGLLPIKEVYTSIDWPVIVLLAAMFPLGEALEVTGGTERIANAILHLGSQFPGWTMIGIILFATMILSSIINNAATVVLMAPIAVTIAGASGASIDPFLMAVAIGGSCAFLTPVGHQSNTLVMGPGGYAFTDYMRMGVPLTLLVLALSIPLILFFWPL